LYHENLNYYKITYNFLNFKFAKEMAGIHIISRMTESNDCKQKKITNSSHVNTVLKNLQDLRKYVMEGFQMISNKINL